MVRKILLAVLLSGCILLLAGSGWSRQQTSEKATYVGSGKCKECHQEIHTGWKSTLHPYKFQLATPDNVVGDFSNNNRLEIDGKTTKMSRNGSDFFITTTGRDNKEHTYKIKYVIGEFWKQLYVTEFPNGELHILPAMWIVKTQQWKVTKVWSKNLIYQYACSGCHNTGTQINYDKASNTFKTTWADLGVACEACHGPGSLHVKAAPEDKAETIVNPARIPDPRRAAMVCGACHTRGSSGEGRYGYPHDYKPGGQLNFMFDEKPKLHPDGSSKANRQEYIDWRASGHAREGVMCWDCHYTHRQGTANKSQTKKPGSSLCRSCHQVENRGVHGIHSVNNCVGCHMPPIGKRATKGDVHSHHFKVVSPQATIDAGGLDKQPNSCNSCHYHKNDRPEDLLRILKKIKASGRSGKPE